jgi:hypothetical protein
MSTMSWVTAAIGFAGFLSGYLLRSYVSYRRRLRARRARYDLPSGHRTLMPIEEAQGAKLSSAESAPLVPADAA